MAALLSTEDNKSVTEQEEEGADNSSGGVGVAVRE